MSLTVNIFLLCLYVAVNAAATYLIKTSASLRTAGFIAGLFLQAAGFLMLLWLVKLFPLSVLIPVATGLLIAANSVLGHMILKERISRANILGYTLVIGGVCMVYLNF